MELTIDQLRKAMPNASLARCEQFLPWLNAAMKKYEINTPMRAAHFLAQVAWESGSLRYTEEIASGKDYEGRKDLGNTQPGDGPRFKGRGLLQLTGRLNYIRYGATIGHDLTTAKNWLLLNQPVYAADSAAWFWATHGLNKMADKNEHFRITRMINGSTATARKRMPCLQAAKKALGLKEENENNQE